MENAIDAYLDELEAVNKVEPMKGLRWVLSHLDQVTNAQLERMKRLGLYAGLHSRPLIQGALDAHRPRRARLGHAAVQSACRTAASSGDWIRCYRGDHRESLLHAVVRGDRTHARRPQGQPPEA